MPSNNPSFRSRIVAHAFLLLLCVGLPAAVTWMAPVTVVELSRQGPDVSAKVVNCLFLAIPYRETSINPVTKAEDELHRGETTFRTENRDGRNVRVKEKVEDEAYLILSGPSGTAKVPVSPANIKEVLDQTRVFLATADQPKLRFKAVANWTFSVLVGGLLTLITILYLLVMAWKALSFPIRLLRMTPGEIGPSST
jgi:hypothetical protein